MELFNLLGIHLELPVWFILLCAVFISYYFYMTWYFDIFRRMGVNYDKPLPVLGTMHRLVKQGFSNYDSYLKKNYGSVVGTFFGRTPQLVVSDPDMLKQVLVKEFHVFTNRLDIFQQEGSSDDPIANMLTVIKDERWKNVRSTLTPTFSGGKMKQMMKQINLCGDQLLKHMKDDPECQTGFDFKLFSGTFTLDIIASTGFGIQLDSHGEANNEFVVNARKFFNFSFASVGFIIALYLPFLVIPLKKYFGYAFFPREQTNFFLNVIRQAIAQRDKLDKVVQTDLLQLMVNAHNLPVTGREEEDAEEPGANDANPTSKLPPVTRKRLTEGEVLSQALLFFLAGYETTANTIGFVGYNLATHPECQDKVIAEIEEFIGDKDTIDYEDIKKMKYLQQVIDETLRLYPQAPRLDRVAKENIVINGVRIPKGMDVSVPVMAMHNDPEFFPDPETFNPDRFSETEKGKINQYTYFPFGMGPRSCIAMRLALVEIKVATVKILQKYKFAVCPKTPIPMKLKIAQMVPEKGFWLKLQEP